MPLLHMTASAYTHSMEAGANSSEAEGVRPYFGDKLTNRNIQSILIDSSEVCCAAGVALEVYMDILTFSPFFF